MASACAGPLQGSTFKCTPVLKGAARNLGSLLTRIFLIVENVRPFPSNLPPVGVCFLSEEQDAALCVGVLAGVTPILPSQVPGHLCDVRAPAQTSVRSPLLSEKPAVLLKWRDAVWFLCFFERHASR